MPTARITKRSVESIPLPAEGKRDHIWDDKLKGFGVMVTSSGSRSYLVQYRMGGRGSRTQTITIGRHGSPWTADMAREHAADLLEQIRKGIDPKAAEAAKRLREESERRDKDVLAFSRYADLFIKRHAVKKGLRSTPDIEAVFRRDLRPRFGDRSIRDLSRAEIARCLDEIGDRSGSAANKAHKWLKKMLNFAAERGDIDASPMDRMKPPHDQQSRERALTDAELQLVWSATAALGYPFGPFTQLLILTGQRLREVAGMQWSELDAGGQEWLIPGTRTKNGNAHLLPLNDAATEILRLVRSHALSDKFVFTTTGRSAISGFSKAKARLDREIADRNGGQFLPSWTFHDLRRTVATGCQKLGIPIDHTEALLNHTGRRRGIVSVYQVYDYRDEKAAAIERWGHKVASLS